MYILILIGLVIWICSWYFVWLKTGKEHNSIFEANTLESAFPPNRRTPALVEYLVSQGNVTNNSFTATVLYLVKEKMLQMSSEDYYENGSNEKKFRYIFRFIMKNSDKLVNIGLIELNVYNFLLQISVNGEKVTSDQIKMYMSAYQKEARDFFFSWKKNIKKKAQELQFIEKESLHLRSVFNVTNTLFVIFIVQLLKRTNFFTYFRLLEPFEFTVALVIVSYFFGKVFLRWNKQYGKEVNAWLGFKNYILNISRMKRELPQALLIWEDILIYATALGVAEKVSSNIPLSIMKEDSDDPSYGNNFPTIADRERTIFLEEHIKDLGQVFESLWKRS